MKIAQVSTCHEHTPPTKYGSINRIVSAITEELINRGHDVTLFATGRSRTEASLRYVFEEPREGFYNIDDDWVHVIKALSTDEHFDVVHNHNIYGGVALSRLADCQVYLTTCHTKPNMHFLRHFLPHNFVALSQSHRRIMAPLQPLAVVYPGLDFAKYPFRTEKDDYLLYLGQISYDKGTLAAIEVANSVGMELQIAGVVAPWNTAYFETEIKPLLGGRIRFIGEVGGDEKLDLLSRARCLLFPSNAQETFGLAMIEAMACGTPVVGSTSGAIPEVIVHGQTGFSVCGIDALANAVHQVPRLDPNVCRQHVLARFSPQRMVDEYLALYERLLGE